MLDHPTLKLGRKSPKNLPAIMLGDILTGVIPEHPKAVDWLSPIKQWILGGNDRFGVCGPVSMANSRLLITTNLTDCPQIASQEDIFDLYRRSGNPNFDPDTGADDNGVDMQTMMEAAHEGGFAGTKLLAFAKGNPSNVDHLRAINAIFGGANLGVTLMEAQQIQTDVWQYSPGRIWGGHAILSGRYTSNPENDDAIVSWANVYGMSDEFEENQIDEIWVPIWPEHLGTKQFQVGIDIDALKAAYKALTGGTLST